MIDQAGTQEVLKPYRKPEIQRVRLVPEEAVLGNCKTPSAGGGSGVGAGYSCAVAGCPSAPDGS